MVLQGGKKNQLTGYPHCAETGEYADIAQGEGGSQCLGKTAAEAATWTTPHPKNHRGRRAADLTRRERQGKVPKIIPPTISSHNGPRRFREAAAAAKTGPACGRPGPRTPEPKNLSGLLCVVLETETLPPLGVGVVSSCSDDDGLRRGGGGRGALSRTGSGGSSGHCRFAGWWDKTCCPQVSPVDDRSPVQREGRPEKKTIGKRG